MEFSRWRLSLPSVIPMNAMDEMDFLDRMPKDDKELIKKSWTVLAKKINETAYDIFEMIFNQSPDTKQLFPFMKFNTNGQRSKEMEFHGLRFMQVLESVVKLIDTPASLDPLCDNLGRVHGRLAESRGFKTHHWGVFIECTLFHFRRVLSGDSYFSTLANLDRAVIVWRQVLRGLIKRMKVGLATDLRNRQVNQQNKEGDELMAAGSEASISPTELSSLSGSLFRSRLGIFALSVTLPPLTHSNTLPIIGEAKSEKSCLLRPLRDFQRRFIRRNAPNCKD